MRSVPAEDRAFGPADRLPQWAQAALPTDLAQESDGVWAPAGARWNLEEQARTHEEGARRTGGGLEAQRQSEHLLRHALDSGAIEIPRQALLLDLRSGDGARSVLPWLDLLPEARVIASDPASMSLAALMGRASREGFAARVVGLVADADEAPAAEASLDVVSGVGCLHQMPDPDRVIGLAARALRPGGHAIFTAPFDGHGILRAAYERICAEAALWPENPLPTGVAAALRGFSSDIAARTLPDRADPGFGRLRDKWLFSREAIEGAARQCGFSDVRFLAHNDHETLYRDFALVQLRSVTGAAALDLPAWALAVLDSFDAALRPPVKRLLMLEGTIVLRR